jgi:hypothetical protein
VGDTIDVKGPVGHYVYDGRGSFTNNRKQGTVRNISLIAGGTGARLLCARRCPWPLKQTPAPAARCGAARGGTHTSMHP